MNNIYLGFELLFETSKEYITKIIIAIPTIIIIILIGTIIIKILKKLNHNIWSLKNKSKKAKKTNQKRREKTIIPLIDNLIKYIIGIIILFIILYILGFHIQTLIAGAGILGVVLAIAAQNLINDIVSGFFVIFEDHYSVGDYVKIQNNEGFVEEIGIKSTILKTYSGEKIIIPNGKIIELKNYSLNDYYLYHKISINYEESYLKQEKTIIKIIKEMEKEIIIAKEIEFLGIDSLDESSVNLLLKIKVSPEQRHQVARDINRYIKIKFEENNIDIPFNRLVIIEGNKKGD